MAKAKLEKLSDLNDAVEKLKLFAAEYRETLDEKRNWWDEKTERWQDGEKGQEWDEHLTRVEELLDEIDNLEPIEED